MVFKIYQHNLRKSSLALITLLDEAWKEGIDVLLLQEVPFFNDKIPGLPNSLLQYIFYSTPINRKIYSAILVLNKFLNVTYEAELSNYAFTSIKLCYNHSNLRLISGYLHPENSIVRELLFLDKIICSPSQIIIGLDSNAHSDLWFNHSTDARGRIFENFMASKNLILLNKPGLPTWSCGSKSSTIDLTLKSATPYNDNLLWEVLPDISESDHAIINITLSDNVSSITPTSISNFNLKKADWNKFINVLDSSGLFVFDPSFQPSLNELEQFVENIHHLLFEASVSSIPLKKESTRLGTPPCPWWNDELNTIKKLGRIIKRVARKFKNLYYHCKPLIQFHRRIFRREIRKAKKNHWVNFLNEYGPNQWGRLYSFVKGGKSPIISIDQINLSGSSISKINQIKDFFFPAASILSDSKVICQNISLAQTEDEEPSFTKEELLFALSKIKVTSAAGPDRLPPLVIIKSIKSYPDFFLSLFNYCLRVGLFPNIWKQGRLIFLKKSSNSLTLNDLRPITILNSMSKVFERLIHTRLSWLSESKNWLSNLQFGFRPGRSTNDALFEIKQKVSNAMSMKGFCAIVSLDIKKAFDSAWWDGILQALKIKGCPNQLWILIKDFFRKRISTFLYGNKPCSAFPSMGIPQGSILSPLLWNIYFNEVLTLRFPSSITVQAYADDLVLLSSSLSPLRIEADINFSLTRIEKWCKKKHLYVNPLKTKACLITNKRVYSPPIFELNNIIISLDSIIKILGVVFDSKFNFKSHISYISKRLKNILPSIISLSNVRFGLSAHSLRLIYTSLFQPLFIYGCHVWYENTAKSFLQTFKTIQRMFALRITRGFFSLSHTAALVMANLIPIELIIKERYAIFHAKEFGTYLPLDCQLALHTPFSNLLHPSHRRFPILQDFEVNFSGVQIFVDGSCSLSGSRIAACIFDGPACATNLSNQFSYSINPLCGPRTTECAALLLGFLIASDFPQHYAIQIASDSQSAIFDFLSFFPQNQFSAYCQSFFPSSSRNTYITWVQSHSDSIGNNMVDTLSKEPAPLLNAFNCPPSINCLKLHLRNITMERWSSDYLKSPQATDLRYFFPALRSLREFLSKINLKWHHSAILSGHGYWKSHLFYLGLSEDAVCRGCESAPESLLHLVLHCAKYEDDRKFLFRKLENQDASHFSSGNLQLLSLQGKKKRLTWSSTTFGDLLYSNLPKTF